MAKGKCDWVKCPDDIARVVNYFFEHKDKMGQGGNPDNTLLNQCAAYLASFGPPLHGDPKTATSISGQWTALRKIHDSILAAKQKSFPGLSGWTYSDDTGFNVVDSNRDAWRNLVKTHTVFKPFATQGWEHWEKIHAILPTRARGKYRFNAAASTPAGSGTQLEDPPRMPLAPMQPTKDTSIDDDYMAVNTLLSLGQPQTQISHDDTDLYSQFGGDIESQPPTEWSQTQPLTDWSQTQPLTQWSQTQFSGFEFNEEDLLTTPNDRQASPDQTVQTATPGNNIGAPPQTPAASSLVPQTPARAPTQTPAGGPVKRAASDDTPVPWESSKRARANGPEAIRGVASSIDGMAKAVMACFAPAQSSALSPTKLKAQARALAKQDHENMHIGANSRRQLHLLFGTNLEHADAYITEEDPHERRALAGIMLQCDEEQLDS